MNVNQQRPLPVAQAYSNAPPPLTPPSDSCCSSLLFQCDWMIPLIAIAATTRILGSDTKPTLAMRLEARIGRGD